MKICATAYITEYTQANLGNREEGEVLLIHSTGMYLRFDTEVFLLCDKSWGQIPIGIMVENYPELIHMLQPEQGQRILRKNDQLLFPSGSILLRPVQPLTQDLFEICPEHRYVLQAAEELAALGKTTGISMLVKPLVLGKPCDLTVQQNPYCARAHRQFEELVQAFCLDQSGEVAMYTEKLLGLGTGLTPSSDDVILGMLYVFRRLSKCQPAAILAFQNAVESLCESRTNRISASYLKAILRGAPFERMEQVYRGLCEIELLNTEKLVQIGSNSGSEMLLGMLIALRICGYDVSKKEESQ